MRFDAIVHAPTMRVGARLNIAAADQPAPGASFALDVGAKLDLKLGVCCPDRACGTITGHPECDPDSAVLTIGAQSWTIRKAGAGIADPGLLSETWFVMAQVVMAPVETATDDTATVEPARVEPP